MINKDIIEFYYSTYRQLGFRTKMLLSDQKFIDAVCKLKDKWHLNAEWQHDVLEEYVERIDHDLRVKANEESCFEIEEKLNLVSDLRFHHGLDRALVDLYVRRQFFGSEEQSSISKVNDPRANWVEFVNDLEVACQKLNLVPEDSLFIYRNILGLPLINISQDAITPIVEYSYDENTRTNTIIVRVTDTALKFFAEDQLEVIKDSLFELKNKKEKSFLESASKNMDMTWYYKATKSSEITYKQPEEMSGYLLGLIQQAEQLFEKGN